MPRSSFSVKVEGLEEASRIPGWLDSAQERFLHEAAEQIADAVGAAAPRKTGRLAASWKGRALSSTRALIASRGTSYAKAQARGAYITPKSGKALRFSDGSFRRFARIPATNYDRKGLRKRGRIIRDVFARAFGDIKRGAV